GVAVVIEPENHAAEARVVRDIFRLDPVEREPPTGAILSGELGDSIHRVAYRAFVPGSEGERAGNRGHVVRVGPVFHLRLEPLPLVPELLEDRGRTVGEGERAGEDLDHGPAAGQADRLRFLSARGRLALLGVAVARRPRVLGAHDL